MLTKDEEIGCFEILKNNFPNLNGQSVVISVNEFLLADTNLNNFICKGITAQEAALHYIQEKVPYIVLDESEGYKCVFFRGTHIKAQFDATNFKMLRYVEETL
jgi:hypothetical protein